MVEITATEQNKKNQKNGGQSQTSGTILSTPTFEHYRRPRRKKKGMIKYLVIIVENFQHGKGNSQSSPGSAESPIQDKPKEKQAKTHINQTNKN